MKNKTIKIVIWIILNACFGLVIAFLISEAYPYPFIEIFAGALISTYIISSLSAAVHFAIDKAAADRPIVFVLMITIPATVTAAVTGLFISFYVIDYLFGLSFYTSAPIFLKNFAFPVIVINISITF